MHPLVVSIAFSIICHITASVYGRPTCDSLKAKCQPVSCDVMFYLQSPISIEPGRIDSKDKLQFEAQTALAPIAVGEQGRDAALGAAEVAHRIAELDRLDLDHFRTLFRHHHGRERRGDHGRELQNLDAF